LELREQHKFLNLGRAWKVVGWARKWDKIGEEEVRV
jgi:hypothetical protein